MNPATPIDKINDLLEHSRDPVSLDMPVGSEEEAGRFHRGRGKPCPRGERGHRRTVHTDIRSVLALSTSVSAGDAAALRPG